jgi:6,7-dimethyl-8-ribityllumazine synthase
MAAECPIAVYGTIRNYEPISFEQTRDKGSTMSTEPLDPTVSGHPFRYAVVVSEFNSFITDQLLRGALNTLKAHQVPTSCIEVVHVPGAYEIPITASLLAKTGQFDAVICLGCLIRGGTLHYELIAHEAARGIGESALQTAVPHSFGVITCDTQEQAIDRAGLKAGNKGSEAALAAIYMAALKSQLTTARPAAREGVPQHA